MKHAAPAAPKDARPDRADRPDSLDKTVKRLFQPEQKGVQKDRRSDGQNEGPTVVQKRGKERGQKDGPQGALNGGVMAKKQGAFVAVSIAQADRAMVQAQDQKGHGPARAIAA
jgi:hypothetical protein